MGRPTSPTPLARRPAPGAFCISRDVALERTCGDADGEDMVVRPLPLAVVLAALVAFAGFFVFARPEYHAPSHGTMIDLSRYPAADRGWTWRGGTPGFGRNDLGGSWNISQVRAKELASARATAAGAGVVADTIRVMNVARLADGLYVLLAAQSRGGRTCIGAALAHGRVSFFCPDSAGA